MPPAGNDTKKEVVRRELERIRQEHGVLSPEVVLREARSPKHPLHRYFEWDNRKAAHEHRLQQAYQLILANRMAVVVREAAQAPPRVVRAQPAGQQVRRYVNTGYGCGFVSRNEVLVNDVLRSALIAKKLRELKGWCESVADIQELASLRREVMDAIEHGVDGQPGGRGADRHAS